MKVIGLTGGIASGKSTVSGFLTQLGASIIDADVLARKVVEPGEKAYTKIVQTFGSSVLSSDKTVDRKALANLVFSCPDKLDLLNKIIHPEVINKTQELLQRFEQEGVKVAVIDAPLLIEAGMTHLADEVWLVSVDPEIQLDRAVLRDKATRSHTKARISAQMSLADKERYAYRIINNSGTTEDIYKIVEQYYSEL